MIPVATWILCSLSQNRHNRSIPHYCFWWLQAETIFASQTHSLECGIRPQRQRKKLSIRHNQNERTGATCKEVLCLPIKLQIQLPTGGIIDCSSRIAHCLHLRYFISIDPYLKTIALTLNAYDIWTMAGRRPIGAIEPPPGVVPNFVNPPSIEYYTVLCATICLPLVTISVGLRMFTKVFVLHKVCIEDCMCQFNLQTVGSQLTKSE